MGLGRKETREFFQSEGNEPLERGRALLWWRQECPGENALMSCILLFSAAEGDWHFHVSQLGKVGRGVAGRVCDATKGNVKEGFSKCT